MWRNGGNTRTSTTAHRRWRAAILTRDPACRLAYPGCTGTATQADHIVPHSQGGQETMANGQGVCNHCHKIKTQAEAQAARPSRTRTAETHPGLLGGG